MSTATLPDTKKDVSLSAALHVIKSARRSAEAIGVAMNIAVVDDGNNLVAFQRMDGAWLGSVDIAQGKAYTARAFNMSTKDLAPLCQPGEPLFGIHASNDGRLIIFAGGIPLERDGEMVGAIGVSGGAVEQDHVVATAGAEAF
ncbi:MAG TPA: heme-binding protein [Solirubrobacteraceae bacterium]|nr:heme-binding protein [Solirubrobacteraceae bacterium]